MVTKTDLNEMLNELMEQNRLNAENRQADFEVRVQDAKEREKAIGKKVTRRKK